VERNAIHRPDGHKADCWYGALLPGDLREAAAPGNPAGRRRAATFAGAQPRLQGRTANGEPFALRAPEPRDVDAIVAACRDPESQRWTTVPRPYGRPDAEVFVTDIAPTRWAYGDGAVCAVVDGDDQYVGSMELRLGTRPDTGDVGYLDADSFLHLTDRKAFMIISGGVNIYPQEAENLLVTHPRVMDCAVFGVPNPDFGEEVKAVVQLVDMADAGPDLERELIAYCREHLADVKCPPSAQHRNKGGEAASSFFMKLNDESATLPAPAPSDWDPIVIGLLAPSEKEKISVALPLKSASESVDSPLISMPLASGRVLVTPSTSTISCTSIWLAAGDAPPIRRSATLPLLVMVRYPPAMLASFGVGRDQG